MGTVHLAGFSQRTVCHTMSHLTRVLNSGVRRILIWQALIVVVVACAVYVVRGNVQDVLSAGYGGSLAVLVTFLLGLRLRKAAVMDTTQSSIGDARLYLYLFVGALERFGLVALGLGVGMGYYHFRPVLVIMGLAAAHMGYLFKLPDRRQLGKGSETEG